jgi:glycosyltransferase involved in cell wall biosynthesis
MEMSIALAHPYCWPEVRRGGERYVDELAGWLRAQGNRVDILTGTNADSRVEVRGDGAIVRRRRHLRRFRLARFGVTDVESFGAAIWPTLLRRRYDVVHAMTPTAALAARAAGQRTVYTVLGHPTADQLGGRRFDLGVFRAAVRASHRVTALSRASAGQVAALFGRPAAVLPPGVHCDRFPADLSPRRPPPRILFSASYSDPRKGLDRAVLGLAELLGTHADARLVLSGQGDASWALERLGPSAPSVSDHIEDLGPGSTDEVPGRYRDATLTLLPSTGEAFGLVLVESLAAGTPVVCTRDGGMPEIVSDDGVGRTVSPDDISDLARALVDVIALAAEPGTPERCSRHARKWDWAESVGPRHLDLYQELLHSRSRAT